MTLQHDQVSEKASCGSLQTLPEVFNPPRIIAPGPGADPAAAALHPVSPMPDRAISGVSSSDPPPPPPASPLFFPPCPGESPRAYSAFMGYFDLGPARSLSDLAEASGEKLDILKKWSSRFRWSRRIQDFNSGLLQCQAGIAAAARAREAADWARRTSQYREQEWETSQKLLGAVRCFLESFGDREVENMTLAQVSRAFLIASRVARQALNGSAAPDEFGRAPIQVELSAALKKAYSLPPPLDPSGLGHQASQSSSPAVGANTTQN